MVDHPPEEHSFERDGFAVVKSAFSPEICQLVCDYTRLKARVKPNVRRGNDTLANIHREYGDPMMETLSERLLPMVEQVVGRRLWPTLSFYYVYANGNELVRHTDRPSCEIVAGLTFGNDANDDSWPLILDVDGKTTPVHLAAGDVMVFRGHDMEHWRERFEGQWFVSMIAGYVDQAGPNAFLKYDQRAQMGKPHIGMFRWMLRLGWYRSLAKFN